MSYSFIWDMDGTLVDSYPAIVPAAQEACAEYGLSFTADYIHEAVIRTSVGAFLEEICTENGLDPTPVKAHFNQLNDTCISAILLVNHAEETLRALTSEGNTCFTEIVTALDGFPRKPDPAAILYLINKYSLAPTRCFYVGDRSLDIEAANSAGIRSVLYLDPSSPIKATGNETFVVSDLIEILDIISKQS